MMKQKTIQKTVQTVGVGLHSGTRVQLVLRPAPINTGIVFFRNDFEPPVMIPGKAHFVGDTRMASVLINEGVRVSTVEHLLAAVAGMGIDNLYIDVNAEEIPIMDGSAAAFVYLLMQAGLKEQDAPRQFLKVKRTVEVREGQGKQEKWASLSPHDGYKLDFFIEFNHPAIDSTGQTASIDFAKLSFNHHVSRARTFGFMQDVEMLRGIGLARGGSMENAIVMDEFKILNGEGLRYDDEFVRHKILDAIGDLFLVGYPLIAHYQAHKSGHALNNTLLRALLDQPDAWEIVSFDNTKFAPPSYATQVVREWELV